MKSRAGFFRDFLERVSNCGFSVVATSEWKESDLVAEVYLNSSLFCSISQDGEIFYEYVDAEQLQKIDTCAVQSRAILNFCSTQPLPNSKTFSKIVNIAECAYWTIVESTTVALLYRFSGLFGYEFATCQKSLIKENRRSYYNFNRFYSLDEAYRNFCNRSGLSLSSSILEIRST